MPSSLNKITTAAVLEAIQVLRSTVGGGKVLDFSDKKRYEDVRFNVIIITRGWVGVQFPEKKALHNT